MPVLVTNKFDQVTVKIEVTEVVNKNTFSFNQSTLSLSWLLASLRKICFKMAEKSCRHHFSICPRACIS